MERLFFIFIDVFLPLIVGYFFHKYKIISVDTCNLLLKLNIRFVTLITGLGSFWLINIDQNIFLLSFVGFILCSVVPGMLAYPYAHFKIKSLRGHGAYLISSTMSNIGILGGLCAFIAMGQLAYAYVQVIAMAQNIFTLILGIPLAEYFHQKIMAGPKTVKFQPHWRSILISWNQIGLISMFIGAVLNVNEVARPFFFDYVFNAFVHIGAWCGILPVGYLLNFKAARIYKYIAASVIPIRFLIIPVLSYIIAVFCTIDPLLIAIITLIGCCPIGINAVVVTQLYNLNTGIAEAMFVMTTAVFIFIAYPLFLLFML